MTMKRVIPKNSPIPSVELRFSNLCSIRSTGKYVLIKSRFMHSFQRSIGTQYGNKLAGAPADSSLNQIIFFRDVFEPVLSKLVWNIVDAGANVGYFTLLMAQKAGCKGKVISIEAAPGNVARLIQNIRLDNFDHRVEVISAACSDCSGALTFYLNSKSDMLCRLQLPKKSELDYWLMGKNWQSTVVRADRLSALVGNDAANVSLSNWMSKAPNTKCATTFSKTSRYPRILHARGRLNVNWSRADFPHVDFLELDALKAGAFERPETEV
jgi:FkbM family methyltransferase